jgi:hypothetical protein
VFRLEIFRKRMQIFSFIHAFIWVGSLNQIKMFLEDGVVQHCVIESSENGAWSADIEFSQEDVLVAALEQK